MESEIAALQADSATLKSISNVMSAHSKYRKTPAKGATLSSHVDGKVSAHPHQEQGGKDKAGHLNMNGFECALLMALAYYFSTVYPWPTGPGHLFEALGIAMSSVFCASMVMFTIHVVFKMTDPTKVNYRSFDDVNRVRCTCSRTVARLQEQNNFAKRQLANLQAQATFAEKRADFSGKRADFAKKRADFFEKRAALMESTKAVNVDFKAVRRSSSSSSLETNASEKNAGGSDYYEEMMNEATISLRQFLASKPTTKNWLPHPLAGHSASTQDRGTPTEPLESEPRMGHASLDAWVDAGLALDDVSDA